mgnify:CR=1 FL=1|tara:strand:+ start:19 stop:420 length:402 start_codon:yes stop_codon:yes gene_type:complete
MINTDSSLSQDDKLSKVEYKKWTAVRVPNGKKQSMYKNEDLVKKRRRKVRTLKSRDKEFIEEIYVLPSMKECDVGSGNHFIHKEAIKTIPHYFNPNRITWWQWIMRKSTPKVEHDETCDAKQDEFLKSVLREI